MYAGDIFRAELDPYDGRGPARGDIVVFTPPPGAEAKKGTYFLKRVIGLPGELIEMDDFEVFIDGQRLDEPYLLLPGPDAPGRAADNLATIRRQQIPPGQYYLMGDNRSNSYDSRAFGPVPLDLIIARALVVTRSGYDGQKGKDLTRTE
jgi:signal peptidase I